ncbi:MAG: glycosyltransferase family 4 protein [Opitutaceae bacterium]|nr:glycosyltransferase family 4 protein [Opitutaceae bacterium]
MSVLLFHPSVAIFVQQVARSLLEAGQLERFITTVLDEPRSIRQRLICAAGRLGGRDLGAQFRRRRLTEIPIEKVEAHPWGELMRLATAAVDRDGRATDFVWEKTELAFDRLVARRLNRGLRAVYGWEHSSLATFQRARELGVAVVYDVPAPETRFVQKLLAAEIEKFPELRTAYHRHTAVREDRRTARRRAEWDAADVILVNSQFTKNSYEQAGLDCSRVRVANLGAPPPVSREQALAAKSPARPLTLLWAGTFSIRKGAHYLLEAWRSGRLGLHARLRIFGSNALPDRTLHPLPEGIEFHGSIPRDELLRQYGDADALIFPTLCDGFGMVVTEAWSRGVPVITTDRAGAADLLRSGNNGMLIRAADPAAIIEAVAWCHDHRPELQAMRETALATAAAWQWHDYRRLHASILRDAGLFGVRPAVVASKP